jgi:hypothetical protein
MPLLAAVAAAVVAVAEAVAAVEVLRVDELSSERWTCFHELQKRTCLRPGAYVMKFFTV